MTDVSRLDLGGLRALDALLSECSVTRAADRLGISQPAMSAQLRRLREIFGDPILTRSSSGSVATSFAVTLSAPVKDILRRIHNLVNTTERTLDPVRLDREFRVVATDYVARILFPPLLRLLRKTSPSIKVDIKTADRTRVRELLENGEVDLGFGTRQAPTGRLRFKSLFSDEAVCIASTEQYLDATPLPLDLFCSLPHIRIVPRRPSFYDEALEQKMRHLGLKRNIALTLQEFLYVPDIVRSTSLVAVVPKRLVVGAAGHGVLLRSPPLDLPECQVGMYWHESTSRSASHRWFRRIVMDASREIVSPT
jgi:DNA-binding transcriptional LysR family regulator